MPHPLFVSDLDGTLLQPDGQLSEFGRATLADLTARGVPFTVASGRSFASIRRALGQARLNLPVISSDGALISSFDSPAPLHLFSMDDEPLDQLLTELATEGYSPILDVWDGSSNFMLSEGPTNPVMQWYHDHRGCEEFYRWRHEPTPVRPEGSQVISITLLDRPEWLEPLKEDLEDRYGDRFKIDYMVFKDVEDGAALWVQHFDARKENALAVLGKMLGYQGSEVVVFGDELNDLGMFGREWHAVAVGNAREELKGRAREIIGHHADDAVLKYIVNSLSQE
jgi:Cof subfamily protein (haloacid dehalogenase superfamily)